MILPIKYLAALPRGKFIKDEIISDNYWFNISSFKMFVSEFWGRIGLAERIVKFHRKKNLR